MTGWIKLATFVAAAAILAIATGGAGATATPKQTSAVSSHVVLRGSASAAAASRRMELLRTADLRTHAGAARFLRAIGLDPRHVVIQLGTRNYAGPKCPGRGWTCTKARRVLQMGTANLYTCSPRTAGSSPNSCVILQNNGAGNGTATCTEVSTGPVQTCSVTQVSTTGTNTANVTQGLAQGGLGSGTQNATQNAVVLQTTGNGANKAFVTQGLVQALGRGSDHSDEDANDSDDFTPAVSTQITQQQDAHQNVYVKQVATGGSNASTINQGQLQVERADHAPKITQLQNTNLATAPTIDTNPSSSDPATKVSACPTLSAADDPYANQCNTVQQTSSSGTDNSQVRQSYNEFQAASNCCTTQQGSQIQGRADQKGGLDHRFTQASSGLSTQSSDQVERQIQRRSLIGAAGVAHEQHGPTRKGTGTQTGNGGDAATQNQSSTQLSTPGPNPNNTNLLSDQCTSSGNCSVTQTTNENGVQTTKTDSGPSITVVTSCAPNCNTPPPGSLVVPAGSSASQTTSVNVPAKPPMADIELAIDTTGSMADGIADAVSEANAIVSGVQGSVANTQFAVVQFKDFGDTPEYQVAQPMTSSATDVSNALGTLSAFGGGDAPEAYNLVFQNSYSDGSIGWRAGTRKFVIVIGDAEPHGANTAGFTNCADTSADPHGLNTATVLAGMNSNQRTLLMIRETDPGVSTTLACYQQLAAAGFTGGSAVDSGGSGLAPAIVSLINSAFSTISDVHLTVASASAGASPSWLSFSPTNAGPLSSLPATVSFTETATVPAGTPSGTYTFDVAAIADGADIGHHTVTVFVP